ncbi:MAG: hypothetical protein WB987_07555 [Candidatus Acidiferrales bacterium]
MSASAASHRGDFFNLLAAPGRSPEIPESQDVYGWLVGSWDLEVLHYAAVDVAPLHIHGEAHFGWVLEGRAIQDVWIMPRVADRTPGLEKTNNMYGSTLRVWDASIQAWRIRWINPVTGHREDQIGRRIGTDIVQIGGRVDGTPTRWRFTEIAPDSFHWIGDSLRADGSMWILEGEFRAMRIR